MSVRVQKGGFMVETLWHWNLGPNVLLATFWPYIYILYICIYEVERLINDRRDEHFKYTYWPFSQRGNHGPTQGDGPKESPKRIWNPLEGGGGGVLRPTTIGAVACGRRTYKGGGGGLPPPLRPFIGSYCGVFPSYLITLVPYFYVPLFKFLFDPVIACRGSRKLLFFEVLTSLIDLVCLLADPPQGGPNYF